MLTIALTAVLTSWSSLSGVVDLVAPASWDSNGLASAACPLALVAVEIARAASVLPVRILPPAQPKCSL